MKRILLRDVDELNVLVMVRWFGRVAFMFGFGVVFAILTIMARWSVESKRADVSAQYTAIRLQAENEQLRDAVAEMQKQLKPEKKGRKNMGGTP